MMSNDYENMEAKKQGDDKHLIKAIGWFFGSFFVAYFLIALPIELYNDLYKEIGIGIAVLFGAIISSIYYKKPIYIVLVSLLVILGFVSSTIDLVHNIETRKQEAKQEKVRLAKEKIVEQQRIEENKLLEKKRVEEEKRLEQERIKEEKRLEQERIKEEKRLEQERLAKEKRKNSVKAKVQGCSLNYVGGVDLSVLISNKSDKTIKYVELTSTFINAVNDVLNNEIGGSNAAFLQVTGPIKSGRSETSYWRAVFYNSTTKTCKVRIDSVEFMDGEKIYYFD